MSVRLDLYFGHCAIKPMTNVDSANVYFLDAEQETAEVFSSGSDETGVF